jgi:hypothetical protein
MSKQSIAKIEQKYTKPDPKNLPVCMNCASFTMDVELSKSEIWRGSAMVEKNKMCKLGNFVVQKMATCEKFNRIKNGIKN